MPSSADSAMVIVEDDDHFRETFIDVMSLKGVEVTGARNGDEAIRALKRQLVRSVFRLLVEGAPGLTEAA